MIEMLRKLRKSSNIKIFVGSGSILNGLKILAASIKIQKWIMFEDRNQAYNIESAANQGNVAEKNINRDGLENHHLMTEAFFSPTTLGV